MFLNSLRTYLGFESHPLRSVPLQTKGLLVIFRNRPQNKPQRRRPKLVAVASQSVLSHLRG
jgi:hypothetical protein